jgi:hypothetical protein
LPAGLRGWNGVYSLFPFRAELALPLGQVEAEEFDIALVNLGLSRNEVLFLADDGDSQL